MAKRQTKPTQKKTTQTKSSHKIAAQKKTTGKRGTPKKLNKKSSGKKSSATSLPNAPVAIIMGSDSDWPVMKSAGEVLEHFKVPFHVEVVSAHRTPKKMVTFASNAHKNGFQVIIAGAGGAAHLPGMVASMTPLPTIGVPVALKALRGLDSLLSIAQMPKGVPVATMAINNGANAGLLALRILGLRSASLREKLFEFQSSQKIKVKAANKKLKKELAEIF